MNITELSKADIELFDRAKDQLIRSYHPQNHQVAAAVRTSAGGTYLGVHLASRRINICAESSAIANAVMADATEIDTVVAVCTDESGRIVVTNPCGVCRELLGNYGPRAKVIIDIAGRVGKVPAAQLLPSPWNFPHENNWTVEEPREA